MLPGRSIYLKFLAVLIIVFVLIAGLTLEFIMDFRLRSAHNQLSARLGTEIAHVASLISGVDIHSRHAVAD